MVVIVHYYPCGSNSILLSLYHCVSVCCLFSFTQCYYLFSSYPGGLKDTIAHFTENLDPVEWKNAVANARKSDVALVLGTSMNVQPAASLPYKATTNGGQVDHMLFHFVVTTSFYFTSTEQRVSIMS